MENCENGLYFTERVHCVRLYYLIPPYTVSSLHNFKKNILCTLYLFHAYFMHCSSFPYIFYALLSFLCLFYELFIFSMRILCTVYLFRTYLCTVYLFHAYFMHCLSFPYILCTAYLFHTYFIHCLSFPFIFYPLFIVPMHILCTVYIFRAYFMHCLSFPCIFYALFIFSMHIFPCGSQLNSLHPFSFYSRVESAAAVSWVLVKVNRCSGLKVVKKIENRGIAN